MQQTNKYQLNLIETSDPFSPVPLNENAGILEAQLARLDGADAALEARADGLEGRVTALEVHKMAVGNYVGNKGFSDSSWRTFELGFTPILVIVQLATSTRCSIIAKNQVHTSLAIIENGFQVRNVDSAEYNYSSYKYFYFALG